MPSSILFLLFSHLVLTIVCVVHNGFGFTTISLYLCFRESAMALNSLYPDGWFALGAAALKVIYVICIWDNSLFYGVLHPNICAFCRFYQK
jgi:hypothetical protein